MFPWLPGFHWTLGNLIFLGIFYSVTSVVITTVVCAVVRSRRDLRETPAEVLRWRLEFDELPRAARACRHELSGEVRTRVCDHGFDCPTCAAYAHDRTWSGDVPEAERPGPAADAFGLRLPVDRLYHRGHTWARLEPGSTITVGMDDLSRRLVGQPDRLELPAVGARLWRNGLAWRTTRRGCRARFLSPVDGVVTALGGPSDDWILRLAPPPGGFETRHLLSGTEVGAWMRREVERLQLALSQVAGPCLADGGAMVEDVPAVAPQADWDAVWGEMFLEP